MSANKILTAAEREMLIAIRQVLDIPHPASYNERQAFYDTLSRRVALVVGCLDVAGGPEDSSLASVVRTCRAFAAEPLGYKSLARRAAELPASGG